MKTIPQIFLFIALSYLTGCNTKIEGFNNKPVGSIEENETSIGILIGVDDDEVPLSDKEIKSRFTPTVKEAREAERILKNNIREFISTSIYYNETMFTDSLENYVRQYAGFINHDNEKEILINFLWHTSIIDLEIEEIWKTRWITVWDGGDYFWRIRINLNQKKLHSLSVNGVA